MSKSLTIEYGDDVLFSLGLSQEDFAGEARFLLAAKLYELGKLTSGQAAGLCGQGRMEFLLALSRVRVTIINLWREDAESELEFLRLHSTY
jgi:predicted HTH domain antitoxin